MKKVLLVEDDPFIRDLTSIKLTEHAFAVLVASDGETALEQVEKETPDIILLDIDLPGISGLEVLRKLKESDAHRSIPVMIFSNNDSEEIKKEARDLGIAGFYIKVSTTFEDLVAQIKTVIKE